MACSNNWRHSCVYFWGLVLYYIWCFKEYNKINNKATIQNGISLLFGELLVNLKVGKIQEICKPIKDFGIRKEVLHFPSSIPELLWIGSFGPKVKFSKIN